MRSTQELNIEKHEAKLAAMEAKRLKTIEDGLQRLDSLDEDKSDGVETAKSTYVTHATEKLKKILSTANIIVPE